MSAETPKEPFDSEKSEASVEAQTNHVAVEEGDGSGIFQLADASPEELALLEDEGIFSL